MYLIFLILCNEIKIVTKFYCQRRLISVVNFAEIPAQLPAEIKFIRRLFLLKTGETKRYSFVERHTNRVSLTVIIS